MLRAALSPLQRCSRCWEGLVESLGVLKLTPSVGAALAPTVFWGMLQSSALAKHLHIVKKRSLKLFFCAVPLNTAFKVHMVVSCDWEVEKGASR